MVTIFLQKYLRTSFITSISLDYNLGILAFHFVVKLEGESRNDSNSKSIFPYSAFLISLNYIRFIIFVLF